MPKPNTGLSPEAIAQIKAELVAARWRGAADLCRKHLAAFPSNTFLLASAHKAAVQLGELDQARAFIERALAIAPDVAAYHLLNGRLLQKLNKLEPALSSYRRAAELAPQEASHHAAIAWVLEAQERHGEALASYRAALGLDPSQAGWWNRLARIATLAGELPLALEAYTRSLDLKEDFAVRAAWREVQLQLRSGAAGAVEASPSYYDDIYRDSPKYAEHGSQSGYVAVWRELVALLTATGVRRVLDLGCGPGQFAEFLHQHAGDIEYTGLDFSEVAIEQARRRCPSYRFRVVSLPQGDEVQRLEYDAAVCTEVLEHIEHDVPLVESVPPGRYFVATVPSYDSFGHLRYFKSARDVLHRYGGLLSNPAVIPVALSPTSTIWLFHGSRTPAIASSAVGDAPRRA